MNVKRAITPSVTIADQPSASEIEALKAEGYVGVINLRNDGEPEQPLDTKTEGELARSLGLDYLHYGVGGAPLSEAGVNSVCEFLTRHAGEGKVLVHCRKGARAAALVLIHEAQQQNWASNEALTKGHDMGLALDGGLRTLVEDYLRNHPTSPG